MRVFECVVYHFCLGGWRWLGCGVGRRGLWSLENSTGRFLHEGVLLLIDADDEGVLVLVLLCVLYDVLDALRQRHTVDVTLHAQLLHLLLHATDGSGHNALFTDNTHEEGPRSKQSVLREERENVLHTPESWWCKIYNKTRTQK